MTEVLHPAMCGPSLAAIGVLCCHLPPVDHALEQLREGQQAQRR
ncbi:hypothetical protein [Streptomyces sp. 8N616]